MGSTAPPSSTTPVQNPKRWLKFFVGNVVKNKNSFIQFFAMSGMLLLSCRSLGQKYRIHDLREDTLSLMEENQALTERVKTVKTGLLHQASLEPTGVFASRLRRLFDEKV